MFAMLGGRQAQMIAGLSTDAVAEDLERFSEICPRDIAEASQSENFVANVMQSNKLGCLAFVEMTLHSIANLLT
jgi:hypothetical protein